MTINAPIALFVYNRPDHTRQTVSALLKNVEAENSDLYIFSDAAKKTTDEKAVQEVRSYIKQVTGFNKIEIIERKSNWGLANSIIDGVTNLCDTFGQAIVLEDDLVVSPKFLEFMNDGLKRYVDEERVMQIAGYMFPIEIDINDDALFLPMTTSWGWATWKRAWLHFDAKAKGYELLKKDAELKSSFDLGGNYPYFKMLESYKKNLVNSWAIRWYLSVFLLKGLVLYPKKTLVENVGFDGSGVNCLSSEFPENPIDANSIIKKLPNNVDLSPMLSEVIQKMPKSKRSLRSYFNRLWRELKFYDT